MNEAAQSTPADDAGWLERLASAFGSGHDQSPEEAFQRRFLLGCDALGLAVTTVSVPQALVTGQHLAAWFIAGFGGAVLGLALLLRAGQSLRASAWAHFALLAGFFFLASVQTDTLQPEQLGWLVLLPLFVVPVARTRAPDAAKARFALGVPLASALAALVALAIVAAHQAGFTFHQRVAPSPWLSLAEFLPLLFAVTGMVTLYDRLLRRAERENRSLRELLPVCAWCHHIRNERGAWQRVDLYLREEGTHVTHSICPSCAREHFAHLPGASDS